MQTSLQLSDIEMKMMNEVFEVMDKYKTQTRPFGLQLVHQHFPISEDEILFETHNKRERTLFVSTKKINDFKKFPLATAWDKSKGQVKVSMFCCDDDDGGYGQHEDF
jgi:hypothetical protein